MPFLEWVPIITAVNAITLFTFIILTNYEKRKQQRVFAIRLRSALDRFCISSTQIIARWCIGITRHRVKLSWYYSIHTLLIAVLAFLGATYTKIEAVVIANRNKAKQIRREKNASKKSHLAQIAEHKEQVQLSPAEKQQRKDDSLRGK